MNDPVVILGCGYTGRYLAERLVARGVAVVATSRHPQELEIRGVTAIRFDALEGVGALAMVPRGARVVYSIPVLKPDPAQDIVRALGDRPARVVYLSTTGVYGATAEVNEDTPANPNSDEGRARVEVEQAFLSAPFSSMVLRPAAIYGPGRGVHVRIQQGTFRLAGDGSNYVSRIHVEDLAAHVEAALYSDPGGEWPVADDYPETSREIARFCAALLQAPMPECAPSDTLHHTRRANRRVDGSAVRRLLGLQLRYPSYREGISAALGAAEAGYPRRKKL